MTVGSMEFELMKPIVASKVHAILHMKRPTAKTAYVCKIKAPHNV